MDKEIITKQTLELPLNIREQVFHALESEFEQNSIRKMKSQMLAFSHNLYMISYVENKGFVLWWNFPQFIFIEYILVNDLFRNTGVGTSLLNMIKCLDRLAILEVERDGPEIEFYEKNGFYLSKIHYHPIRLNELPTSDLQLMSYDHVLSNIEYNMFMKAISSSDLQF